MRGTIESCAAAVLDRSNQCYPVASTVQLTLTDQDALTLGANDTTTGSSGDADSARSTSAAAVPSVTVAFTPDMCTDTECLW